MDHYLYTPEVHCPHLYSFRVCIYHALFSWPESNMHLGFNHLDTVLLVNRGGSIVVWYLFNAFD